MMIDKDSLGDPPPPGSTDTSTSDTLGDSANATTTPGDPPPPGDSGTGDPPPPGDTKLGGTGG